MHSSPSPSGRYRVKLWILDGWRAVTVDDRIPVDLFGEGLFAFFLMTSSKQRVHSPALKQQAVFGCLRCKVRYC